MSFSALKITSGVFITKELPSSSKIHNKQCILQLYPDLLLGANMENLYNILETIQSGNKYVFALYYTWEA